MRAKHRWLMALYTIIILAWAVGVTTLLLWQSMYRNSSTNIQTKASQPKGIYPTTTEASGSGFGELLSR